MKKEQLDVLHVRVEKDIKKKFSAAARDRNMSLTEFTITTLMHEIDGHVPCSRCNGTGTEPQG